MFTHPVLMHTALDATDVRSLAWPSHDVPKQMHMDFRVPTVDELERHRRRAEELGASMLLDRTEEPEEPLYVLADPAGHPFCILVGSQ